MIPRPQLHHGRCLFFVIKGRKWCRQQCWHPISTRDSECVVSWQHKSKTTDNFRSPLENLVAFPLTHFPGDKGCVNRSLIAVKRSLEEDFSRSVPTVLDEKEAICWLQWDVFGKRKVHFNAIIAMRSTFRPFSRFLVKSLTPPQWIFRQINLTVHR